MKLLKSKRYIVKQMGLILMLCLLSVNLVGCNNSSKEPNIKDSSKEQSISLEKAQEIALKDAGISSEDANIVKTELDRYENISKYEIEFYTGNKKFEYDIDSKNGNILSFSSEEIGSNEEKEVLTPEASVEDIGIEKAKEIVLNKVPGSDGMNIEIEKDYDDGRLVYEGELYFNSIEYEFEIDASTGEVISWEEDSFITD